ncbi:hypothetical protein RDABS01_024266 [Bienertia sinuspersici]
MLVNTYIHLLQF